MFPPKDNDVLRVIKRGRPIDVLMMTVYLVEPRKKLCTVFIITDSNVTSCNC